METNSGRIELSPVFKCQKCGKQVHWALELVHIKGLGIQPAYVHPFCNTVVPEISKAGYLKTGDVVIPNKL